MISFILGSILFLCIVLLHAIYVLIKFDNRISKLEEKQ